MCELNDCEVQSLLSTQCADFDVESLQTDRSTESYSLDDFRGGSDAEHWKPHAVWTASLAAARFIAKCRVHRAEAPASHPEQTWIVFDWDDTLMPTSSWALFSNTFYVQWGQCACLDIARRK